MAPQISRAGTVRTWRMGTSIVVIVIVGRRRIVVRIRRRIGIRVHIGIVVVAVIAVIRIGVTGPAEADPIAEAAISPAPMTAITAEPASKMASAEMAAAKRAPPPKWPPAWPPPKPPCPPPPWRWARADPGNTKRDAEMKIRPKMRAGRMGISHLGGLSLTHELGSRCQRNARPFYRRPVIRVINDRRLSDRADQGTVCRLRRQVHRNAGARFDTGAERD